LYEKVPNSLIRQKALQEVLRLIRAEDENTKYLDLGPVNKAVNMLVTWVVDGPESDSFKKHLERIPDFMWYFVDVNFGFIQGMTGMLGCPMVA
jgi:lanosterol synthase